MLLFNRVTERPGSAAPVWRPEAHGFDTAREALVSMKAFCLTQNRDSLFCQRGWLKNIYKYLGEITNEHHDGA